MAGILAAAGTPVEVKAGDVTYVLLTPSAAERQHLRAAVAQSGAQRRGVFGLLALLKAAVQEVAEDGEFDSVAALINRHAELWLELVRLWGGDDKPAAVEKHGEILLHSRQLDAVARVVLRAQTTAAREYAAALADEAVYQGFYGLAAARLLLDRIEGGGRDWKSPARGRETPAAVLDKIPDEHFDAIAQRMLAAAEISREAEKN